MLTRLLSQPARLAGQPSQPFERKRHAIAQAGIAGIAGYGFYAPVLAYLGSWPGAALSVGGALIWGVALLGLRRGEPAVAAAIMQLELVVHVLILVAWMGLAPGFHYHLWAGACLGVTNPGLSPRLAGVLGVLCVIVFAGLEWSAGDIAYVYAHAEALPLLAFINQVFAGAAVVAVVASVRVLNEAQQRRLLALAAHDPLTGLLNRRSMGRLLEQVKALADRGGPGFSVALADIDYFKRINDRYGHDAGDDVLKQMAGQMRAQLRRTDSLARWGGEEFLIVLTHTDRLRAARRLERLRASLASQTLLEGHDQPITLSFGVTAYRRGEAVREMVARADERLYRAKAAGRDCVVAEDEPTAAL